MRQPPFDDLPDDATTIQQLREAAERLYWHLFRADTASRAHSFLEFVGVMNAYLDMVQDAVRQGVPLSELNVHSPRRVEVPHHRLRYLGEKLGCIFAPFIRDPEAARVLRAAIFGEDGDR